MRKGQWMLVVVPAAIVSAYAAAALLVPSFRPPLVRARALALHRWLGRLYVVAVAGGGAGGLIMATRSDGGFVTHIGFGLLAILWLATTAVSYRAIRRGDSISHRRWMLRSYSLTFAAVTLRIYLPIALTAGLPFIDAYQVISWACWIPNLLFVEWWLLRPSPGLSRAAARQTAAARVSLS